MCLVEKENMVSEVIFDFFSLCFMNWVEFLDFTLTH